MVVERVVEGVVTIPPAGSRQVMKEKGSCHTTHTHMISCVTGESPACEITAMIKSKNQTKLSKDYRKRSYVIKLVRILKHIDMKAHLVEIRDERVPPPRHTRHMKL